MLVRPKQFAVLFTLASCACVLAQEAASRPASVQSVEMVENPLYKHWSQFKPGSFATMKIMSDSAGMTSESTVTWTLKEVTPDKVVIETLTKATVSGNEMTMPAQPMEIMAKVSKVEAEKAEKPEGKVDEGDEDIEVVGKKMKSKWIETVMKYGDMTTKSKVWTCDGIPGQICKMISETEGPVKAKSEGHVVEFKANK